MVTHSSICAWRISWTEEPGGLQSMGSQREMANDQRNANQNHNEILPHNCLMAIIKKRINNKRW